MNEEMITKAREKISQLYEHADYFILGTNSKDFQQAFERINDNLEYQEGIYQDFGVKWSVIKHLFDKGVMKFDNMDFCCKATLD